MRIVFCDLPLTGLCIALLLSGGCAQPCVHQSMLLHENRRLENALYVTHAQLADMKQENEALRNGGRSEDASPNMLPDGGLIPPVLPIKSKKTKENEKLNNAPPFELPTIEIPGGGESKALPQTLKSSQSAPVWSPQRVE
ncbi:MAG: hypothetical protein LBT46_14375 [Planctomycetaceae bacterium]|jgi:hypothetical protein|nr:hypothetical protein [Planctomycetaceae bacterium]